ncbi:MAG: cytosine deaminase [Tindallia sp. MSAO_Bac2]|nr:MAG: cytosine deaminase [Tindallia sp. MSAO_Bac2]
MKYDVILKNAGILDEAGFFTPEKHVLIFAGKIMEITDKWEEEWEAVEIIDASDLVISPGFVNLHTHSPMNLLRGLAEDVNIDDWFNKEIWPYESKMNEENAYAGALAACCEMLHHGVTAFADHYMFGEQVIKAVQETGIRCDFAPTVFGVSPNFNKDLESALQLIEKHQRTNPALSFRLGPHAPYTCPPETLKKIVDEAKGLEVGLHIHLSETEQQLKESLSTYGKTPFQMLSEAGGFELPLIIAHGLWITEKDLHFLEDQSYMAVSPKTYLKLAMGSGKLWQYWDQLPLTSGTDGAASSNSLDPLEQVRYFGLMGKHITGNAEKFNMKNLWKILMRGHSALPFESGKMGPGYVADLICWNLNSVMVSPVYDPLATILYSADHSNIEHVMVNGKWMKRDGSLTLDEGMAQLLLRKNVKDVMAKGKGKAQLTF